MDANFGIPAAVMEMLCGSSSDVLRILPALPAKWTTGEFSDMLTRTGVRTSASWDMENNEIKIELRAVRDADFDLKFPQEIAELSVNRAKVLSASEFGSRYRSVKLAKGEELKIDIRLK